MAMVGKRGGKIAFADKRQMCLLQTKEGNFSILLSWQTFSLAFVWVGL